MSHIARKEDYKIYYNIKGTDVQFRDSVICFRIE